MDEFQGNARYRIIARLGAGGMGTVYEAHDRVRGIRVALKAMAPRNTQSLARFKREFRVVADLHHPNLVQLYDLARDEDSGVWFYTMDLVDGTDLASLLIGGHELASGLSTQTNPGSLGAWSVVVEDERREARGFRSTLQLSGAAGRTTEILDANPPIANAPTLASAVPVGEDPRPGPSCDLNLLGSCLAQILDALEFLHERGIVHRDLKPENVLVGRQGDVRLLDFGIVKDTSVDSQTGSAGHVIGTVPYLSPEQAAGREVGPASDLYSLGCMLFELVTGHVPFDGPAVRVLLMHQTMPAPSTATLVKDVPADLCDIIDRLLAKAPDARPSINEIRNLLGIVSARERRPEKEIANLFVGREPELERMRRALTSAASGNLSLVFVAGESGSGKTALSEALLREAIDEGFMVFRGRCYERENMPFRAFDRVMDELALRLSGMTEAKTGQLDDAIGTLARIFPTLDAVYPQERERRARAAGGAPAVEPDPLELRQRALKGLLHMVQLLGMRAPIVVLVDDLQWTDQDSVDVLMALSRHAARTRVCIVGLYRPGDVSDDHPLRRFLAHGHEHVEHVELGPLSAEAASRLVRTVVGTTTPPQLIEEIVNQSGAQPFFLVQLALAVRERGGADGASDTSLQDLIQRRLDRIGDGGRRVLEVAALSGGGTPRWVLRLASKLEHQPFNVAMLTLLREHMLRPTIAQPISEDQSMAAGSGRWGAVGYDVYHDRIRDAVITAMSDDRQRRRHAAITDALESRIYDDSVRDLGRTVASIAQHARAAGDLARAREYGVKAAESAADKLAFAAAAAGYEELLADPEFATNPEMRARHLARLAELYESIGDYLSTADALRRASDLLEGTSGLNAGEAPLNVRRAWLRLGAALMRVGDVRGAATYLDRLLARLDMRTVRPVDEALSVLKPLRLRTLFWRIIPEDWFRRDPTDEDRFDLEVLTVAFESLGLVHQLALPETMLRYWLKARRLHGAEFRRRALVYEVGYDALMAKTEEDAERCHAKLDAAGKWSAEAPLEFGAVYSEGMRGYVEYRAGRWAEAERHLAPVIERLESEGIGRRWDAFFCRVLLVRALLWSHDPERATPMARRIMESSGDDVARYAEGVFVLVMLALRTGAWHDAEVLLDEWGRRMPKDSVTRLNMGYELARAWLRVGRGEFEEALAGARAAHDAVRETGAFQAPVNRGEWLAPQIEAAAALAHKGALPAATRDEALGWARWVADEAPDYLRSLGHRGLALLTGDASHIAAALDTGAKGRVPYFRYLALEAAVTMGHPGLVSELSELSVQHGFVPPWTRS